MINSNEAQVLAANALGVTEEWEIVSWTIQVAHMQDPEGIADDLDDTYGINRREVAEAIEEAITYVDIPSGWRLVGMRKKGGDQFSPRKYGFVDFTSLGAA